MEGGNKHGKQFEPSSSVHKWQLTTLLTSSTFLTSGREFLMNVILPILKS